MFPSHCRWVVNGVAFELRGDQPYHLRGRPGDIYTAIVLAPDRMKREDMIALLVGQPAQFVPGTIRGVEAFCVGDLCNTAIGILVAP